jgi:hypothetical protein
VPVRVEASDSLLSIHSIDPKGPITGVRYSNGT